MERRCSGGPQLNTLPAFLGGQ